MTIWLQMLDAGKLKLFFFLLRILIQYICSKQHSAAVSSGVAMDITKNHRRNKKLAVHQYTKIGTIKHVAAATTAHSGLKFEKSPIQASPHCCVGLIDQRFLKFFRMELIHNVDFYTNIYKLSRFPIQNTVIQFIYMCTS